MLVIAKNEKRSRHLVDARLVVRAKTGDRAAGETGDSGSLTGLLASYGTMDYDGEIIRMGCFAKSLAEKLASGGIPLMKRHFADGGDAGECIGTITQAHEEASGLIIDDAPFSDDDDAQAIRKKIVGKHVRGLSVGFYTGAYEARPPKDDNEKAMLLRIGRTEVIEWIECEIAEGTVTCRPCNANAEVTGAKARSEPAPAPINALNLFRDAEAKERQLRWIQL